VELQKTINSSASSLFMSTWCEIILILVVLCHSKDRSPSPVSDLPPTNTVPHQNISITSTSSGGSSNGRGVIGVSSAAGFPITSHSSVSLSDGSYIQQSPKVRLKYDKLYIIVFLYIG
jgi:hypothetical protein